MKQLLMAFAFVASASAFAAPATFSGNAIQCDSVDWINMDGSFQCNNPIFTATVTNGTTTLSVDAKMEHVADKNARAASGLGICKLIGYASYVGEDSEAYATDDINVAAEGPFIVLDGNSNVVSMDKTTKSRITSVTCK